ncbi:GNAT family N-acetyltransferase [Nocardia sp. CNY236]|uniref:GNAT family N-acetyltransferase n=1 Tax=Nocardia sp. CNY236 TaxID=1169152 RepID=UPI0003F720E6|nr:GNAT family N-acetyltransferase [Nocardia sp. CNY236]
MTEHTTRAGTEEIRTEALRFEVDDLTSPEMLAFLAEHLTDMAANSPPDSVHALAPEALRDPSVTIWSVWEGSTLVGCGALKTLDPEHAEVKSMRTAAGYTRRGIASALLTHIIAIARNRGYRRLSLETGSADYYRPAIRLYQRHDFQQCPPFGEYTEDPHLVFMTLEL